MKYIKGCLHPFVFRSLLLEAHEDQLAEITTMCKQEMKLLMAVKLGDKVQRHAAVHIEYFLECFLVEGPAIFQYTIGHFQFSYRLFVFRNSLTVLRLYFRIENC